MEFLLDTRGRQKLKSLLIIYLFVVNTAGDCPKPEGSSNMILSDEALLRNDFPEDSEVTLLCITGYFSESGSGIIKCINQKWTEPDLICKKKDCGPPTPKPHMQFNISHGTLFGAILQVYCDKGYKISGMSYLQCFDMGWFGKGTCNIVKCGKPPEVANGRSLWVLPDNPKYEDSVRYSCDDGYTLIGNHSITCNEKGQYNSQPPECKGVATEHIITTKKIITSITTTAQETSTSAVVSATPTAPHRDNTITVTASLTVSPSEQGGKIPLTHQDKAATTTSASFEDKQEEAIDTKNDFGYTTVVICVIAVTLVACICVFFLNKFLLRRKGSYDTGEDLKPELLQFQNL